jgi:hypothetical protein
MNNLQTFSGGCFKKLSHGDPRKAKLTQVLFVIKWLTTTPMVTQAHLPQPQMEQAALK